MGMSFRDQVLFALQEAACGLRCGCILWFFRLLASLKCFNSLG